MLNPPESPELSKQFVQAMRMFPGAANIITTGSGDDRAGFTATACMSLTADPPQIGVAVNRSVSAYPALVRNGTFCVNTLASSQHELAAHFAGPVKGAARFLKGNWSVLQTGAPALEDAVVNLDCVLADRLELSTHTLFVGRVVAARQRTDAVTLLYVNGDWASYLPGTSRDVEGLMQEIETVTGAVDRAAERPGDPLSNLEVFVREWAKIYMDRQHMVQKYMSAELYVSPSDLQNINAARRRFDDRLTELLAHGAEAGKLDIRDPRLTAFAIAGLVGWLYRWFKPDGRLTREEIGDLLAHLVRKMVEPSPAQVAER